MVSGLTLSAALLSSCALPEATANRTLALGAATVDSFGAIAMALWTGEHEVVGDLPNSCVAFIDELFGDEARFDAPLSEALVDLALNDTAIGVRCKNEYRAIQAGPTPIVIVRDVEESAS